MLTESSVSLLTGTFPGVTQRRIMLIGSSVSLLTGTFPWLLNYRGGQVALFNVFSLLGQAQVCNTCELPPYWIIPGFNCVYTKDNTLKIHVVPRAYIYMQIRLDLAKKLTERNAVTFPVTIPTQKFNIEYCN